MAVPAHDKRDFEFAQKFNLPIIQVVAAAWPEKIGSGFIGRRHCGEFCRTRRFRSTACPPPKPKRKSPPGSKKKVSARRPSITNCATGCSAASVTGASRFRLFGKRTPPEIFITKRCRKVRCRCCRRRSTITSPPPTGEPPLARAKDWVNLPDGSHARDQHHAAMGRLVLVLSALSRRQKCRTRSSARTRKIIGWARSTAQTSTPGVDLYVGGTEHAVLHLLYARFWHKVLFDLGYVSTPEPFFKLVNQGMILGEDEQKMSKSRGNVVNPDDVPVRNTARTRSAFTKCSWGRWKWSSRGTPRASRASIVSSAASGACSWMKKRNGI